MAPSAPPCERPCRLPCFYIFPNTMYFYYILILTCIFKYHIKVYCRYHLLVYSSINYNKCRLVKNTFILHTTVNLKKFKLKIMELHMIYFVKKSIWSEVKSLYGSFENIPVLKFSNITDNSIFMLSVVV